MPALERTHAVCQAEFVEHMVEVSQLEVVEVVNARDAVEGEGRGGRRADVRGEARAAGDHTGHALLVDVCEEARDASAAGEARGVDAPHVNVEARVRVVPERSQNLLKRNVRPVARVVRADDDVAVAFGGLAEKLDGNFPPRAGVEGVDDGPTLLRRVARR